MASIQRERTEEITMQLSLEEKASLDGIIKQAECSLESQELMNQSLAIVAENECLDKAVAATLRNAIHILVGTLKNQTKGDLSIMASKKYGGHIVSNFPNPLHSIGTFSMSAMTDKGLKAAVVYSGKNKAGVECAWLLAFAETKATGWRIYAECGRKGKFNHIDWAQVEKNLNKAGTVAKAYDKETGTSVYATIVGNGGKSVVGATFLG